MTVTLYNMTEIDVGANGPIKLCKKGHPLTPDNVTRNGGYVTCRTCKREYDRARRNLDPEAARAKARAAVEKYRRARGVQPGNANARKTHCPQGHEYTEENTYWYGEDGKARQCKTCRNEHVKASYQRHREERLASGKARREANPEVHREEARRWQRENRERANLIGRIKKQRRRNAGTLTVADWELVLDVYGRNCLACGKDEVTIDHVIPVSKGGPNVISNVQPLCGTCNTSKGTKTIDYRPEPWADIAERAA